MTKHQWLIIGTIIQGSDHYHHDCSDSGGGDN